MRSLALQVVLRTTAGDIDIELWPKEAPKACSAADPQDSIAVQAQPRSCGIIRSAHPHLQFMCPAGGAQLRAAVPGGLLRWLRLPQGAQGLPGPGSHTPPYCMNAICSSATWGQWHHAHCQRDPALSSILVLDDASSLQTGDPTGTGTGSETIYGAPFKDEFHSRLRFSHRRAHALRFICAFAEVTAYRCTTPHAGLRIVLRGIKW